MTELPFPAPSARRGLSCALKGCTCCLAAAAGLFALSILAIVLLFVTFVRIPNAPHLQGGGTDLRSPVLVSRDLDGFESPYIGHTGSWDGKGGAMFGASKVPDLDREVGMGLRWTFMAAYWNQLEPEGPVNLSIEVPDAWCALDAFVIAAQARGLNILMQAPVIGGNAGGPPDWAGRRDPDHSAPSDMEAAAAFAGKMAERYRPGGTLAQRQGWGDSYGILAWELDNEPNFYLTNWGPQPGDYAEFVTKCAAAIKQAEPDALILSPATPAGGGSADWIEKALGLHGLVGSPAYLSNGKVYSIGTATDIVSFHLYEGLDAFFAGEDQTIDHSLAAILQPFDRWRATSGLHPEPFPAWHTEGNFDFLGLTDETARAAWRWQFFTRGFASGVAKLVVMDASAREQIAVKKYIALLPNPFPMLPASAQLSVDQGTVEAFRHPVGAESGAGNVWVLWASNGTVRAEVTVPVTGSTVALHDIDGGTRILTTRAGSVSLTLEGTEKVSWPVILEDLPT